MKKENILPIAYCPIGGRNLLNKEDKDNFLKDPVIVSIAEKHGVFPAQIVLAWGTARGHSSLPKSTNPERRKQNIESLKINLSSEEVEQINKLNKNFRTLPAFRIPGLGYYPIFISKIIACF